MDSDGLPFFLQEQTFERFYAVLEFGQPPQEGHLFAVIFCRDGGGSHVHGAFLGGEAFRDA